TKRKSSRKTSTTHSSPPSPREKSSNSSSKPTCTSPSSKPATATSPSTASLAERLQLLGPERQRLVGTPDEEELPSPPIDGCGVKFELAVRRHAQLGHAGHDRLVIAARRDGEILRSAAAEVHPHRLDDPQGVDQAKLQPVLRIGSHVPTLHDLEP